MLCSVDVVPRVRHVANIFTPFPLHSVGVWSLRPFHINRLHRALLISHQKLRKECNLLEMSVG